MNWNDNPQPFAWTQPANDIIAKVKRGRAALTSAVALGNIFYSATTNAWIADTMPLNARSALVGRVELALASSERSYALGFAESAGIVGRAGGAVLGAILFQRYGMPGPALATGLSGVVALGLIGLHEARSTAA